MPPLHVMIKPVSSACNLKCRYCFYADEASHRNTHSYGIMQNETVRNLIRKALIYADGTISFTFQGGEPILAGLEFFKNFVNTVKQYNVNRLEVSYSVQTNGTLLNDEFCNFFAENGFLIGVSLDGRKDIHDLLRDNSYDAAVKGITLLKKYHIEFNVLCVLTKNVANDIHAVWKSLTQYGHLQFIPCIDSFDGSFSDFSINETDYGKVLVNIFNLYRASFFSNSLVSERRMDNYLSMLLGYPPEHCGMSGKCGIYFLCEADGSVFPCDFYVLDQWKIGNINETSFMRMAKSDVMHRFHVESIQIFEECHDCKYFFICRGGCRRDREPTLLTNRFCKSYKYFFNNCLTDMQELATRFK